MISIASGPHAVAAAAHKIVLNLGTNLQSGQQVGIARHGGHLWVQGRTRCGKTSNTIAPLINQTTDDYLDESGQLCRDAVVVLDLGGDQGLFHLTRDITLSRGASRRFRFLSLQPDEDWDYFDPFQSIPADSRNAIRFANLLIEALNAESGLVYGGSYFTGQNLAALLNVARRLVQPGQPPPTLRQVAAYLDAKRKSIKDADMIRMAFNFLLEYEQLQPGTWTPSDRCIDMARVLNDGEVVYFFTPTLGEATTARQIAGLALYTLVNAAMRRAREGRPLRRCYVFIDEWQELAGRSFGALLAQAAKFGITFVLANQSTEQLRNRDMALDQVVRDNTTVKQIYTVSNQLDVEALQLYSGEHEVSMHGRSFGNLTTTVSDREIIRPRLDLNEILEVSATRGQSWVVIDDGEGFRPPVPVQGHHVTTKAVFDANSRRPLPRRPVPATPLPAKTITAGRGTARLPVNPILAGKLVALLLRKAAAENGTPITP